MCSGAARWWYLDKEVADELQRRLTEEDPFGTAYVTYAQKANHLSGIKARWMYYVGPVGEMLPAC